MLPHNQLDIIKKQNPFLFLIDIFEISLNLYPEDEAS